MILTLSIIRICILWLMGILITERGQKHNLWRNAATLNPKKELMSSRCEQTDEQLLKNLLEFVAGHDHPILTHPVTVDLQNSVLERMPNRNQPPAATGNVVSLNCPARYAAMH